MNNKPLFFFLGFLGFIAVIVCTTKAFCYFGRPVAGCIFVATVVLCIAVNFISELAAVGRDSDRDR